MHETGNRIFIPKSSVISTESSRDLSLGSMFAGSVHGNVIDRRWFKSSLSWASSIDRLRQRFSITWIYSSFSISVLALSYNISIRYTNRWCFNDNVMYYCCFVEVNSVIDIHRTEIMTLSNDAIKWHFIHAFKKS